MTGLLVVVVAIVVVVRLVGLLVVVVVATTPVTSELMSSLPIPLQRSVVQIQAEMESDSIEAGEHWVAGSTGLSILPSRMLVGKHSLITEVSVADFFHE